MSKVVVVVYLIFAAGNECSAWGFYGHKLINFHAVFLLPPEMMALYKPNIEYLTAHSVDPDKRRYAVPEEGPKHYIDMDRYNQDAFATMDVNWSRACKLFTEDSVKAHGIVPWWIQTVLWRLTEAFKEKDGARILKLSADIGHYISDAHVPLHTSSNHNGQYTGQHGIHGFWESRVPELIAAREWDFWIGTADYVADPLTFVWKRIHESSRAADSVLKIEYALSSKFPANAKYAFENRNGVLVRQYSEAYTIEYDRLLGGMIERRMRQSMYAVASFWYTAWLNAGQPDCSKIQTGNVEHSFADELEKLNKEWREGKIRGKSCE